jgi:hypothetical protein
MVIEYSTGRRRSGRHSLLADDGAVVAADLADVEAERRAARG